MSELIVNFPLITPGTQIRNIFNGETFIFTHVIEDPEIAEFDVYLEAGGMLTGTGRQHIHPQADEEFIVRSGRFSLMLNGSTQHLKPGLVTLDATLWATFRAARVCVYRKLSPDVVVVKAAKNWTGFQGADALNGMTNRRIIGKGPMGSGLIIIVSIEAQRSTRHRCASPRGRNSKAWDRQFKRLRLRLRILVLFSSFFSSHSIIRAPKAATSRPDALHNARGAVFR
jgi:hypothetical protein